MENVPPMKTNKKPESFLGITEAKTRKRLFPEIQCTQQKFQCEVTINGFRIYPLLI